MLNISAFEVILLTAATDLNAGNQENNKINVIHGWIVKVSHCAFKDKITSFYAVE